MTSKKILVVIGTRPNFIKVTRFREAARSYPGVELRIVHTGQHYDTRMADVFFEQFGLVPDHFLGISSGSPNSQVADIISGLDELFSKFCPDIMVVVGDVNSTLAASVAANKAGIRLAHVESGLRSFDRTMPEEFNRVITDLMADVFFVTEQSGYDHLIKEGKPAASIHQVGNTMIDTLVHFSPEIEKSNVLINLGIREKEFVLMTIHRPATVDTLEGLEKLAGLVDRLGVDHHIVFPVHPRTLQNMVKFGLEKKFRGNSKLRITEPLDYIAFQKLIRTCSYILTDSGGIQEESTFYQVPCLTLRPNTERPSTVTMGTNTLVPFDLEKIGEYLGQIRKGTYKKGSIPPLWDGHATERIMKILVNDKGS